MDSSPTAALNRPFAISEDEALSNRATENDGDGAAQRAEPAGGSILSPAGGRRVVAPLWLLPAVTGIGAQYGLVITAFAVILLEGPHTEWNQDPFVPLVFLGAAVGAASLGRLGDTAFGRARATQIAALVTVLGALVPAFTSLGTDDLRRIGVSVGRFLMGMAAGGLWPLSAAAAVESQAAAQASGVGSGGSSKENRRLAVAGSCCYLAVGSALARVAVWLVVLATDPDVTSDTNLFFTRDWTGTINTLDGEAGVEFRAARRFWITHLGRDTTEGALHSSSLVTLWSTEATAMLAQIEVGPTSPTESNYAFEILPVPIQIEDGVAYRVSQTVSHGMQDSWYNGHCRECGASEIAEFIGGVYSTLQGAYPNVTFPGGALRLPGVANFKYSETLPFPPEEKAHDQTLLLITGALPGLIVLTISLQSRPATGPGVVLFRRMAFRSAFLRRPQEMRRLFAGVGGSWFLFDVVYFSMTAITPSLLESACYRGTRHGDVHPYCSLPLADVALQVAIAVTMGVFGTLAGVGLLRKLGSRRLNVLGFILLAAVLSVTALCFGVWKEEPVVLFVLICVIHFFLGFGPYVGTYVLPAVCFPVGILPTCHGLASSFGMLGGALGTFLVARMKVTEENLETMLYAQITLCIIGAVLSRFLLEKEDDDYRGSEEDSATELAYSLASPLRRRLTMLPGQSAQELGQGVVRLSEHDLELITPTGKGSTVIQLLTEEDERKAARDGSPTSSSFSSFPRSTICSRQDSRRTSFGSKLFQKSGSELGDPNAAGLGFACKKGLKPDSPNQDSWFVLKAVDDISIYGVFDGHGRQGHDCSEFVKENLPKLLVRDPRFRSGSPEMGDLCRDAFRKMQALVAAADELGRLEATFSGSTATVVVHDHRTRKLTVAHIADSAAVLGSVPENKEQSRTACPNGHTLKEFVTEELGWSCSICSTRFPIGTTLWGCKECMYDLCPKCSMCKGTLRGERLTQDHRPEMEEEKARIEAAGGSVFFDGYANHRVYAANSRFPGLNMSRCLGDLMGHTQCGLSAEPVIREVDLTEDDRLLLICSDGVWEFINAQRSVDLAEEFGPARLMEAAERIAEESWEAWIREEGGNVVDDITVVMIRLAEEGLRPGASAASVP